MNRGYLDQIQQQLQSSRAKIKDFKMRTKKHQELENIIGKSLKTKLSH